MYAIIEDGGRQYKVQEGEVLELDYRDLPVGQEVTFDRVFAVRDETGLRLGLPLIEGMTVHGEILGASQGPKLVIQKARRRKNFRKRTGHRQLHTRVKIGKIGNSAPAAATETPAAPPTGE